MAKIIKGDRVVVLSGKDRGYRGTVSAVFPSKGTCIVDGANIVKKHQVATSEVMQGGIIEQNMPLPLSRVAVISPKDDKPTRVGFRVEDDGSKVRICKRTGATL